jgi:pimeloyl-ACP methyl ester carboxylesterase
VLVVIDKGRCNDAHSTPVLLVHGALHAAWCWDEHFLNFFADNGYRVLVLGLGHGGSPTSKRLRSCSIADYVEDMCSVAESCLQRRW